MRLHVTDYSLKMFDYLCLDLAGFSALQDPLWPVGGALHNAIEPAE